MSSTPDYCRDVACYVSTCHKCLKKIKFYPCKKKHYGTICRRRNTTK